MHKLAVGAHYGGWDWLVQRATALVMLVYTVLFFGIVLWNGGLGYAVWKSLFANGAFRVATFVFMIALLYHAWVGARNVLMDYAKPIGLRLALMIAVVALLAAYAGWTAELLWRGA
ncbi:MAG TPA: succinate dehydrogenase, hydrophobic membrane anchor protein [Casimicrobiaceae bacterium]